MREEITHSQRFFFTLRYLATGNNLEDLKFIRFTSEFTGIIFPKDVFTAQHTDGK